MAEEWRGGEGGVAVWGLLLLRWGGCFIWLVTSGICSGRQIYLLYVGKYMYLCTIFGPSGYGVIGSRARLRILSREGWGFEPPYPHLS